MPLVGMGTEDFRFLSPESMYRHNNIAKHKSIPPTNMSVQKLWNKID